MAPSAATIPSAPPRDFVKMIVATMSMATSAATSRLPAGCRPESATTIAAGRNDVMFIARSFGLPKMPPTGPASRPPSTRLMPRT